MLHSVDSARPPARISAGISAPLLISAVILLGACGGGGSSSSPSNSPPPPALTTTVQPPPATTVTVQPPPAMTTAVQPPPAATTANAVSGVIADPPPPPPPIPPLTPRTAGPTLTFLLTPDDPGFAQRAITFRNSPEYDLVFRVVRRDANGNVVSNRVVRDRHLQLINADEAHARGANGKGEVVMVVDSGIRETHEEFVKRDAMGNIVSGEDKVVVSTQTGLLCRTDPNTAQRICDVPYDPGNPRFPQFRTAQSHGTAVASLIAGDNEIYMTPQLSNGAPCTLGDPGCQLRPRLQMRGVAYAASLRFHQIFLGSCAAPCIYTPTNLDRITPEVDEGFNKEYANYLAIAKAAGANIINFSFGRSGGIDIYDEAEIKKRFRRMADALEQAGTDPADKIIIVWAAGNAGNQCLGQPCGEPGSEPVNPTSVELFPGLGIHFPKLQTHVLAVVATDNNGDLAPFSNPCGRAKQYCLAAPGTDLLVAHWNSDTGVRPFSGTSAAAPVVSGSLAVLRQYFRGQLGNHEVVTRLLATADRRGKYADSDKYGHGMVDLDAATRPVGATMTSLHSDPNARPFNPAAFALSGGAFGAAMRESLGGVEIAAFDELDSPFFFPLADGVMHAPRIPGSRPDTLERHEVRLGDAGANASLAFSVDDGILSAARIRRGNLWFSYGHHGGREAGLYYGDHANHLAGGNENLVGNFGMNFATENAAENVANAAHFRAPLAFASPYLSLVRDGPGLGWSQPLRSGARLGFSLMHGAPQFDHFQNPGGARGLGALFDFRPNNTSLSLQAGAVREADGFLGARAQGNFGEISADTAFAGIGGDWAAMQNWRLLASAYLGHTKADTGDGMLRAADDIVSSAFSLGLARASLARRGDWLGLRLSQPLRAESGAAHLHIPAGRTKYRKVVHRSHKVELTPSGRNLQVEAEYRVPFAGGNLRAGVGFDRHAGHDSARDLEGFLRLGFERQF